MLIETKLIESINFGSVFISIVFYISTLKREIKVFLRANKKTLFLSLISYIITISNKFVENYTKDFEDRKTYSNSSLNRN